MLLSYIISCMLNIKLESLCQENVDKINIELQLENIENHVYKHTTPHVKYATYKMYFFFVNMFLSLKTHRICQIDIVFLLWLCYSKFSIK